MSGRRVGAALDIAAIVLVASAHIGTLNAFFSGKAGPYTAQVTVRPPGVVPGLAQIVIRVKEPGITRVTTQAAQWNVGSRGAPAPDEATRVPGDSTLWSAQLWLMTRGSYGVNVSIEGPAGTGAVTVPVSNIATKRLDMPSALGWVLAGLGIFLGAGLLTIVWAAVRESVLPPGQAPDQRGRARARLGLAVAAGLVAFAGYLGRGWWSSVDRAYASGLFRSMPTTVTVLPTAGGRTLQLTIDDSSFVQGRVTPLIPDHGKMMHLFLVRDSSPAALGHLHPAWRNSVSFSSLVGPLPSGTYRFFADVVHESGYAETMTGRVTLPERRAADSLPADADDAFLVSPLTDGAHQDVGNGVFVTRDSIAPIAPGADVLLSFTVHDSTGAVAVVEPYMGMPGHAMVMRDDGSVFAHLHSNGSFSMAAQEVLAAIERGDTLAARRPNIPRPRLDAARPAMAGERMSGDGHLAFPFAFPRAGRYVVWVQFRLGGIVRTAAFTVGVGEAGAAR